jgi:hypothetical protein
MHHAVRTILTFILCWVLFRFTPVDAFNLPSLRTSIEFPHGLSYNTMVRRLHVPLTMQGVLLSVWNASRWVHSDEESDYHSVQFQCKTVDPLGGVDRGHLRVFTKNADESNMLFYNEQVCPYLWLTLGISKAEGGTMSMHFDAQCLDDSQHSSFVMWTLLMAAKEMGAVLFGGESVLDLPHNRDSKMYRNACMTLPCKSRNSRTFSEIHSLKQND